MLTENLIAFLLQYIGLMLHLTTSLPAPVWLDTGTASAYLFMRGYRPLPGIFAGSVLAYLSADAGIGLGIVSALILTAQPLSLIYLCRRYISPAPLYYRSPPALAYILLAATLTAAASASLILAAYPYLNNSLPAFQIWLQWWLANLAGILTLGSGLIIWDAYFPSAHKLKALNKSRLYACYGALTLAAVLLVSSQTSTLIICSGMLVLCLLLMINVIYGKCGGVTAVCVTGFILAMAAYLGSPLFDAPLAAVLFVQAILLCAGVCVHLSPCGRGHAQRR